MTRSLPLELAEVFKGAQVRAHRDVSVRLLQQTMAKLADAGALQTGLAARLGRQAALEDAQQIEDRRVRFSELPAGRPFSEPLKPSQPSAKDGLPTYTHLHEMEEAEKQAFIFGLARRGAAALARRGGRLGRVGSFLQRPIRNPVTVAKAGPGAAQVGVRSPLGKAPVVTDKPIPKEVLKRPEQVLEIPAWQQAAEQVGKKRGGPYRAAPPTQRVKKVERKAPEGPTPEPRGGYLRRPIKGLAAAGLIGGGLYAVGKGGSTAINELQQATAQPMRPNISGWQQYPYGY